MEIPDILEDIGEIYKEIATKKEVEKINRKVDHILELIQKIVGDLEKKSAEEDLITIPIKKKKKKLSQEEIIEIQVPVARK